MSETLDMMLAAVPESYQKTVGFPTYDILAAAAIPLEAFAQELEEVRCRLDPAKLNGEDLDSYISSRSGLVRNAATCASGVLQVNGTGTIAEGDLFESSGGIQFAAVETVAISGSGEVAVKCVSAGAVGNLAAGSVTQMPVQIAGIVSVSNSGVMSGGYDAESDAAYYARYLLHLQFPPTSGNQYHYKAWALEVTGVGGVQVYPLGHGANTVDVVLIDTDGLPAAAELVGRVQAHIDPDSQGVGAGEAPIGAKCYVSAAGSTTIAVSATVSIASGVDQAAVTQGIQTALRAYFKSIAFAQTYVSYGKAAMAILEVEGVLDFSVLTLNGGTGNVPVADRYVAVLGEVSVAYGA